MDWLFTGLVIFALAVWLVKEADSGDNFLDADEEICQNEPDPWYQRFEHKARRAIRFKNKQRKK